MKSLMLTQAGIYRLQQLANMVRQKTGVRHKLSDQKSIVNLLRYSCTSTDTTVYRAFGAFTDELDDEQRAQLQSRGLLIPPMVFSKPNTASFQNLSVG